MTTRSGSPRVALAIVLCAIVAISIGLAALFWYQAVPRDTPSIDRPVAEVALDPSQFTAPTQVKADLSEEELAAAVALNAAIPIVPGARAPATPFILDPALPAIDRARAEYCLTLAVYYEAGAESSTGQSAVAQVVLNRLRHPLYPQTVCGVVFQGSGKATGCQFTFTCDGALARVPSPAGWRRAGIAAAAALSGYVEGSVGTATHYHTDWVVPAWRTELVKIAQIGTHIFYRWPGRMGTRPAFAMRYRGGEVVGIGGPMLPAMPEESLLAGDSGVPVSARIVPPVPADGPGRLRPAPLKADAEQSGLRADDERGTLTIAERQEKLKP
jgi:spore germination cell wall hydrolase CwlJ-like protein